MLYFQCKRREKLYHWSCHLYTLDLMVTYHRLCSERVQEIHYGKSFPNGWQKGCPKHSAHLAKLERKKERQRRIHLKESWKSRNLYLLPYSTRDRLSNPGQTTPESAGTSVSAAKKRGLAMSFHQHLEGKLCGKHVAQLCHLPLFQSTFQWNSVKSNIWDLSGNIKKSPSDWTLLKWSP